MQVFLFFYFYPHEPSAQGEDGHRRWWQSDCVVQKVCSEFLWLALLCRSASFSWNFGFCSFVLWKLRFVFVCLQITTDTKEGERREIYVDCRTIRCFCKSLKFYLLKAVMADTVNKCLMKWSRKCTFFWIYLYKWTPNPFRCFVVNVCS